MIGLFDWTPKFVRRYGGMRELAIEAVQAYAADIRSSAFPDSTETYNFKSKGISALEPLAITATGLSDPG